MVAHGRVQSSSITTSLLVPMIGAGVLSLEAAFPVTLGANLGTTVTGLIASLAAGPAGLTIALVHTLFNLAGHPADLPVPAAPADPARAWRAGLANRAVEEAASGSSLYIVGVFVADARARHPPVQVGCPSGRRSHVRWFKKLDADDSGLAKIVREFERMLERRPAGVRCRRRRVPRRRRSPASSATS